MQGEIRLRLSLGFEPNKADTIIIKALIEFNNILDRFRFDQSDHASVRHVFAEKPLTEKAKHAKEKKSREKKSTRKPRAGDSYIRNCVRKDDRTLAAYHTAHAILNRDSQSDQKEYIAKAMFDYSNEYVINLKSPALIKLPISPAKGSGEVSAPLVQLLIKVYQYAINYALKFEFLEDDRYFKTFAQTYAHKWYKLLSNCIKAEELLNHLGRLEPTHFHAKATLLIENIMEYLIILDGLTQVRHSLNGKINDPVQDLKNSEINSTAVELKLDEKQIDLYFTDNGQMAITTALAVMSNMVHTLSPSFERDVFLFPGSYYEIEDFFKDIKFTKHTKDTEKAAYPLFNKDHRRAKVVFIDVTRLWEFKLADFPAMDVLVIDTTHNPNLSQSEIGRIVNELHARNKWVVLVESMLKHRELGIDKYQAGKITTLAPPGQTLNEAVRAAKDEFNRVSHAVMHPHVASYLIMVKNIYSGLVAVPLEATKKMGTMVGIPEMKSGITLFARFPKRFEPLPVTPTLSHFTIPYGLRQRG